jgi:hypothetical protein
MDAMQVKYGEEWLGGTGSTPGRMPVINFSDEADNDGLIAVLKAVGPEITWRMRTHSGHELIGQVVDYVGNELVVDVATTNPAPELGFRISGLQVLLDIDQIETITYL